MKIDKVKIEELAKTTPFSYRQVWFAWQDHSSHEELITAINLSAKLGLGWIISPTGIKKLIS